MPRTNTAETIGHNGAPMKHTALPAPTTKRSSRLAVIVAHESAEPSSQPMLPGLASAAHSSLNRSNPILNPKGSIHWVCNP